MQQFSVRFGGAAAIYRATIYCTVGGWILMTATLRAADDWDRMKAIAPQGYVCSATASPLTIDGRLDEAAWTAASWTADFADIEGDRKPRPRFRTRAKMLWDQEYFYIAAELDEPHVWARIAEHDAVIFYDNDFEVFIDPDGDNHEYFELELNALNTTWDLMLPKPYKDGGQADNRWEIPGLKTAVHVRGSLNDSSDQDAGWTVELAIPWKALAPHAHRPAPPKHGDQWRVDFSRVEWRHELIDGAYRKVPDTREDNWVWSPPGIVDMHRPERWGYVQFSTEPPGTTPFESDPTQGGRDVLMETYHRQKTFFDEHGRWARSLRELDWQPPTSKLLPEPLEMWLTDEGFQASLSIPVSADANERWHVRQDSRLWTSNSQAQVRAALDRAAGNRGQLEQALREVPATGRESLRQLVANMPERDLTSLSAEYLLENVRLAHRAWEESPWKDALPRDLFLSDVLPYASINERRDVWRKDFYEQFKPLVKDATTPTAAATILNQKIFALLNVRYSRDRAKADQSPVESIKAGTASCTGLAVLLIDACRSVGVPARFVGTPLWSDQSGNHSWVEIWDDGWHFTGAAEPNGDRLDTAWFIDRASAAKRDEPLHAIYAASFNRTPLAFPLVWDRNVDYVSAVNVSDRYIGRAARLREGTAKVMFRVLDRPGGRRCAAEIKLTDAAGKVAFAGQTHDESHDANDHLGVELAIGKEYQAEIRHATGNMKTWFQAINRDTPFTWYLTTASASAVAKPDADSSPVALASLTKYLAALPEERAPIADQDFAKAPLTKEAAAQAAKLLWQDHVAQLRRTRAAEMKARELVQGKLKMPFSYQIFGDKPPGGRGLVISMHGGGGAPKQVNDQQWENQKRLYKLEEGIYVVPRAPTDTWDLWHQSHIDGFFDRLVDNLIALEDVDPNRVYIMGYSAGGDGVYQLAPRMADRWAAAAMMAGHPNETSPLGLRNLPFTIHVGANDAAYDRNKIAGQWQQKLSDLHRQDPQGYVHSVTIHDGKGHWMDRQDAVALGWMAKHRRDPWPLRIVWKQDDVRRGRFYWLAVDPEDCRDRAEVVAQRDAQNIDVQSSEVERLTVRLCDEMLDLDQSVGITCGGKSLFQQNVTRTIGVLAKTLAERGESQAMFTAEVTVALPPKQD